MEEYIVSARKYRPMSFDSVVGQPALTTTLKNAVTSGKLAHAYLFCGPRGVGKTTCARIFAKAINCLSPTSEGEACNECESCRAFNEQRSYNIFELDAASNNSVESIKQLMEQTRIPPQVGKYKVFIIDEVHMLSQAAFNAFLKTLEEPPAHVVFILATTEKNKILPTILSRCQIYDFERMSVPNIINHLKMVAEKEGFRYEEEALGVIAEKADGGMRDALSIFDQVASFCQGDITYEKVISDLNVLDSDYYHRIVDLALDNKVPEIMVLLNDVLSKGFDGGNLALGLAAYIRNVLMAKDEKTLPLLEVSETRREKFKEQAQRCPTQFLYAALRILNRCDINYRQSGNKRFLVELSLIEVAQITQEDSTDGTDSSGRKPRRLKILFQKMMAATRPQPVSQVTGAVRASQRQHKAALREDASQPKKNESTATEAPKTVSAAPNTTVSAAATPVLGSIGMTFANLRRGPVKPKYAQEAVVENKDEDQTFDQEQLEIAWRTMCNRMTKALPGLSARLKNAQVRIKEYPAIELVVDNGNLLEQTQAVKGRITATLAQILHNGHISLEVRLAEAEEMRKILTKREMFDILRRENPAVERLRTLLSLEMA